MEPEPEPDVDDASTGSPLGPAAYQIPPKALMPSPFTSPAFLSIENVYKGWPL